eukprot:scaffold736_cov114-Skeletonema_dohrnii-CCMP3373.AAC.5
MDSRAMHEGKRYFWRGRLEDGRSFLQFAARIAAGWGRGGLRSLGSMLEADTAWIVDLFRRAVKRRLCGASAGSL